MELNSRFGISKSVLSHKNRVKLSMRNKSNAKLKPNLKDKFANLPINLIGTMKAENSKNKFDLKKTKNENYESNRMDYRMLFLTKKCNTLTNMGVFERLNSLTNEKSQTELSSNSYCKKLRKLSNITYNVYVDGNKFDNDFYSIKEQQEINEVSAMRKKIRLNFRIELAKKVKEQIEKNEHDNLISKIERRKLNKTLNEEKARGWKCCQGYVFTMTSIGFLETLANRYNLRRSVHENANGYFRLLFVSLYSIGKIIRKIKKKREEKFYATAIRLLTKKIWYWRLRRRMAYKRRLIKFALLKDDSYYFTNLVKTINYSIIKLQQLFRRHLARRILMMTVMNLLWSSLEIFSSKIDPNDQESAKKMELFIKKELYKKHKVNLVPIRIRLCCLCKALGDKGVFIGKKKMILLISKVLSDKSHWSSIMTESKKYPIINILLK